MTRRDFGKGLSAILAAGVAPSVLAGGLRRGLAGRLAAMSGGKDADPYHGYVADGLIAYFDGIDNVGLGDDQHSSDTDRIMNLVDGSWMTAEQGTLEVNQDWFGFATNSQKYWKTVLSADVNGLADALNGDYTFELTAKHDINLANYAQFNINGSWFFLRNQNVTVFTYIRGAMVRNFNLRPTTVGTPDNISLAVSADNAYSFNIDDETVLSGTVSPSSTWTSDILKIGIPSATAFTQVQSLLIYNRRLTDPERTANYINSKIRFNLP